MPEEPFEKRYTIEYDPSMDFLVEKVREDFIKRK